MNFLELINKCLLELNYRQVNSFSELVKNEHKRIKSIMNVINNEICHQEGWNFLLRRKNMVLPANETEIDNIIGGRILYLLIDGEKYRYTQNFEPFITGRACQKIYSIFNDKLLFPKFNKEKNIEIIYYTSNSVVDNQGNEKTTLDSGNDISLIPMPFVEELLVYGTCLRLKGNPQHNRFSYWMSMYKEALLNLKSKSSVYANNTPQVFLYRE